MTSSASQPFHQAAKDGNAQLLRRASRKELNKADNAGWTPAHWAAWNGNAELLRTVIDKGADVNFSDNNGSIPLHVAAQYGNLEALECLLGNGSNVWALDDQGRTAATVARSNGKMEAAQYLDTQASYWEIQNAENAHKLKVKAMEQLKKRTNVTKRHSTSSKSYSDISSVVRAPSHTDGLTKTKLSTEEVLRANFELRPPEAKDSSRRLNEEGEGEEGSDSFPQLAPIPKTQTAILVNTLHAIPPSTPLPDAGAPPAPGVLPVELEGELVLSNQITQNDSTLATFLHSLDIPDCVELLHREKIDLESLSFCEEKDLVTIGMPLGHRKKILHGIQVRKEAMARPGSMVDTDL